MADATMSKRDVLDALRRKACEAVRKDVMDGSITDDALDGMLEAYVRTLTRAQLREIVGETPEEAPA